MGSLSTTLRVGNTYTCTKPCLEDYSRTVTVCMCEHACHGGGQGTTVWSQFSLFPFAWVRGNTLRLLGLGEHCVRNHQASCLPFCVLLTLFELPGLFGKFWAGERAQWAKPDNLVQSPEPAVKGQWNWLPKVVLKLHACAGACPNSHTYTDIPYINQ